MNGSLESEIAIWGAWTCANDIEVGAKMSEAIGIVRDPFAAGNTTFPPCL